MKRLPILLLAAGYALGAGAVSIQIEQVRERMPWNGLVDIDYSIAYDANETLDPARDRIEFTVKNNVTGEIFKARQFTLFYDGGKPIPSEAGMHRITWDANRDGVSFKSGDVTITAAVNRYGATYMEIDVAHPTAGGYYPVTYRNGEPPGGYNSDDNYKTNVIVLRYIPAGQYRAGSPSGTWRYDGSREVQHNVVLTHGFWCGIYEITEAQYRKVKGSSPKNYADTWPVSYLSWNTIRGGTWPGGAPSSSSFPGLLRTKCRAMDADGNYTIALDTFDLPTEYQWEYACRAGTTTPFNDGAAIASDVEAKASIVNLAVWDTTNTDGTGIHPVGMRQPNAWGLYDMHGNVFDSVLDLYQASVQDLKQYVDPTGPSSGSSRCRRGGNWDTGINYLTSTMRGGTTQSQTQGYLGFRIVCNE